MKAQGDLRIGHSLECPHCGGTLRKKLDGLFKVVLEEVINVPGISPLEIAKNIGAEDPKSLQSIRDSLRRLRENGLVTSEKYRLGRKYFARYHVTSKGKQKDA